MRNSYNKFRYAIDKSDGARLRARSASVESQ
ncbi:hypothetical protein BH160DRAFT_3880 [Burkholderia sp. H160]|nr:hypothetical protein BH160DRAFT_3880 [Burkholderia sp. H160]